MTQCSVIFEVPVTNDGECTDLNFSTVVLPSYVSLMHATRINVNTAAGEGGKVERSDKEWEKCRGKGREREKREKRIK